MAELNQVYKCNKCGIIVEVVHAGMGKLMCCGEEMKLRQENTEEAATEKHIPVVEKTDKGLKVSVGSVAHPMTEEHWIEWIEVIAGGKVCRKQLNPGDEPVATFVCDGCCCDVIVRAYCNLHGLWKA